MEYWTFTKYFVGVEIVVNIITIVVGFVKNAKTAKKIRIITYMGSISALCYFWLLVRPTHSLWRTLMETNFGFWNSIWWICSILLVSFVILSIVSVIVWGVTGKMPLQSRFINVFLWILVTVLEIIVLLLAFRFNQKYLDLQQYEDQIDDFIDITDVHNDLIEFERKMDKFFNQSSQRVSQAQKLLDRARRLEDGPEKRKQLKKLQTFRDTEMLKLKKTMQEALNAENDVVQGLYPMILERHTRIDESLEILEDFADPNTWAINIQKKEVVETFHRLVLTIQNWINRMKNLLESLKFTEEEQNLLAEESSSESESKHD